MSRPQRGTLRDVRKGNRSVVLWTLYFANELSRHDLAQLTGLSAATVSNVIGDLIADGIVVETGSVDSDGGRPRIMLRVDPSYGYVVGVGVGETRVRVELYDLAMEERARKEFALDPSRTSRPWSPATSSTVSRRSCPTPEPPSPRCSAWASASPASPSRAPTC